MLFELGLFLGITTVLLVVIKLTVTGKAPEQKTPLEEDSPAESVEPTTQQQTKPTSKKTTKTKNKNKTKTKKQQINITHDIDNYDNEEEEEEEPFLDETQPFEAPTDPTRGKSNKAKSDKQNNDEAASVEEEQEEEPNEDEDDIDFMLEGTNTTSDGWNVVGNKKQKKTNKKKKAKPATENKKSEKKSKKQNKKQSKEEKSNKTEKTSVTTNNDSKPMLTEDGEAPIPIKPIYSSAEEFWKPKRRPQPKAKQVSGANTPKPKKSEKNNSKKKSSAKKVNRVVQPNKMEVSLTARGWGKAPQSASVSLDGEFPSLSESKQYIRKKEKAKKDVETNNIDQDGLHSQEGSDGEDEDITSVETPEANGTFEDKTEEEDTESEEELDQIFFKLDGDFNNVSDVKIVGSIPELGSWDINHAPSMDITKNSCTLPLPVEDLKDFEYKYVQLDESGEHWEQGPNRQFSSGTELKINDQWR